MEFWPCPISIWVSPVVVVVFCFSQKNIFIVIIIHLSTIVFPAVQKGCCSNYEQHFKETDWHSISNSGVPCWSWQSLDHTCRRVRFLALSGTRNMLSWLLIEKKPFHLWRRTDEIQQWSAWKLCFSDCLVLPVATSFVFPIDIIICTSNYLFNSLSFHDRWIKMFNRTIQTRCLFGIWTKALLSKNPN